MKCLRWLLCAAGLCIVFGTWGQTASATDPATPGKYLKNPLLPVGPDPWVEYRPLLLLHEHDSDQSHCLEDAQYG